MTKQCQALVGLLKAALAADGAGRARRIEAFISSVATSELAGVTKHEEEVLRDLAFDLDFYEPSESARAEAPEYFGEARLEREIRSTLALLGGNRL